jgi:type I restriction enzyme S subunit
MSEAVEGIQVEESGSLPANWARARLPEIAATNPTLDKSEIDDDILVSFVPMPAVEAETGGIDVSAHRKFAEVKKGYTGFLEGDVLFAKITPCMENGKMAVVPALKNNLGFGSTEFHVLRPAGNISPTLLYYFVSSKAFRIEAERNMTGAVGQRRVPTAFLSESEIPLPPAAEQVRIVAKLEELFSELDKGVENLRTAQQQLKVYRQALLKHAFEGKLTGATESSTWKTLPLGTLLEFLTSGSRGWAKYYADEGDIFIRAQNIKHDWLDLSDIAFVSLPERAEGLRTRVRKGDLLITITGANVTKSALVETDPGTAYVSQHVALCRPTEAILPKYLYWFVIAETAGRKQLNDMAYGAGKPGLNLENIRSVIVPLPELQQQEEVVELIEDKLSVIDQLENTITTSLQQAEALRQSILKKAFSGQLVPQNPEDEPASVLLERIRAEREAQPVAKRPRKPTATAASTPEVVTEVKA